MEDSVSQEASIPSCTFSRRRWLHFTWICLPQPRNPYGIFFSVETNEYDPETCQPDVAEMFIFLPISPLFFCPCVNTRFYFILLIFHSVLLEVNSHTENLSLVLMVEIRRPKLPWAKAELSCLEKSRLGGIETFCSSSPLPVMPEE